MMKITGIKKIATESKDLKGGYNNGWMQIAVDQTTGKAWSTYHLTQGSYTAYDNGNIITCGYLHEPATMAQIKTMIQDALDGRRRW